jgi:hypothetical protein
LDLVEAVVLHDLYDSVEVGVITITFALSNGGHFLLKEFSEVATDGEIDEDILVEVKVIVSFNGLDGLKLLKVTKGVGRV